MAWPVPGMVTLAARVTVLLVMVPLAPALATMVARVTALLVMVSLAPALALLLLSLPALVLAGTRARRLELKRRHEASGLVRGWRQPQQQLPRLQGAVTAAEA